MNTEIRMIQPEDLEQVTAIETVCFPASEAADKGKIRSRAEKFQNHFFVMTENQQIAGFINGLVSDSAVLYDEMFDNAGLHDENGAYQMILSLAVAPEFQGRGYGTALLRHFTESAKAQHRKGVTLTCKDCLVPFYAKSGFVSQGRSESTHGGFEWYEMRIVF